MLTPVTKRLILNSGTAALVGSVLISWLYIKPLGLLFLSIFSFWVYKNKYDIEIIPPENLHTKLKTFLNRIKCTRENNPGQFCAYATGTLSFTALVGHFVTGSTMVLLGIIATAYLTSKYNFKILRRKISDRVLLEKSQENETDIDEFLPEVNDNNMSVLERASDQSSAALSNEDVDEKSEEVPSDLLIPDCIPEIDEHSTDEDDELSIGVPDECTPLKCQKNKIEFRKGHFKKDSSVSTSSSDEENLSKGLSFPDFHQKPDQHFIEAIADSYMPSTVQSNILPNFIAGVISLANSSEPKRIIHEEFSDDEISDFEIVRSEEI